MENTEGFVRGYIRSHKAYYSKFRPEQNEVVMIGWYTEEVGGTLGEFRMQWYGIGNVKAAQLQVFEDCWEVLWKDFRDLLEKLAEIDGDTIQEEEFCAMLDGLGIVDMTEYKEGQKGKANK